MVTWERNIGQYPTVKEYYDVDNFLPDCKMKVSSLSKLKICSSIPTRYSYSLDPYMLLLEIP